MHIFQLPNCIVLKFLFSPCDFLMPIASEEQIERAFEFYSLGASGQDGGLINIC